MVDSTLDIHELLLDTAGSDPFTANPTPKLSPGMPQYYQGQHPMSGGINLPFPDTSGQARTDTWEIPDNSLICSINTPWPVLTTGQSLSCEAWNTVSHRNEILYGDALTKHCPPLTALIVPPINLPTTEFSGNKIQRTGYSLQSFSTPYYHPTIPPSPSLLSPTGPESTVESPSKSPSPAVSQCSSQECYELWKKIPEDAIIITGSDKFVPQTLYRPLTKADKERYLELVHLSPPIVFLTKEPFEWGIPLEDVRSGKMQLLLDKDDPVLQNCGPSISVRINWPGYSPFKHHIPSRNWCKTKGPITKGKLARNLTKITGKFVEEMSQKPLEVDADQNWKVGAQHIEVEDLILVSLHHVSKGSWQPQLSLRRNP